MTATIIRFLNIILVAILAGTSFGICIGFNPAGYTPSTYVEQQQHLITSLNTLMVSLVIMATIITLFSAYIQRNNKTILISLIVAAAFLISCIFISRFGNLPIQNEMLLWKSQTLPENWKILRDRWWCYHVIRTIAEMLALFLIAWTSVEKSNAPDK